MSVPPPYVIPTPHIQPQQQTLLVKVCINWNYSSLTYNGNFVSTSLKHWSYLGPSATHQMVNGASAYRTIHTIMSTEGQCRLPTTTIFDLKHQQTITILIVITVFFKIRIAIVLIEWKSWISKTITRSKSEARISCLSRIWFNCISSKRHNAIAKTGHKSQTSFNPPQNTLLNWSPGYSPTYSIECTKFINHSPSSIQIW